MLVAAAGVGGWVMLRRPAEGSAATANPKTAATTPQPQEEAAPSAAPATFALPLRTGERALDVLAPVYTIDKLYKSMRGPQAQQDFALMPSAPRQLVWITGLQATMAEPDGELASLPEYMCHCNLDIDPIDHDRAYGHHLQMSGRLFTLSQGQLEIALPTGFGIPVWSDQAVSLTTQVLNLNTVGAPFDVRHKVRLAYVTDDPARKPMKPLYMAGVYGLELVKGEHGNFDEEKPPEHGSGCMMGTSAVKGGEYTDSQGKEFTGHWIVHPGREENHTPVTKLLSLPFDTTIHHIAVHLHPFAESLTLIDKTTGSVVYSAKATQIGGGKIGLAHVDSFSSEEGIPVYKDHEYELVSVYDNTSGVDQDSMAVMLLYLLDKGFVRPKPDTSPTVP